jgi:putative phosphoribosyl transferase
LERIAAREQQALQRRDRVYRSTRPLPDMAGRCVVFVDDSLATGATMQSAIAAVHQQHPARLVVTVPVAPRHTVARLREEADEVVCRATPVPFFSIGRWYEDFRLLLIRCKI